MDPDQAYLRRGAAHQHSLERDFADPERLHEGLGVQHKVEIFEPHRRPGVDKDAALHADAGAAAAACYRKVESALLLRLELDPADAVVARNQAEADVPFAPGKERLDRPFDGLEVATRADADATAAAAAPFVTVEDGVEADGLVGDRGATGCEEVGLAGLGRGVCVERPTTGREPVGVVVTTAETGAPFSWPFPWVRRNSTRAPGTGCEPFATRTVSGAGRGGNAPPPGDVSWPSPPT